MNTSFECITTLEYRLKAATAEVMAFKSGEKYIKMQEEYLKELRHLERIIKRFEEELSLAHRETTTVRNQWFEIFEDLQKEFERKLSISKQLNKQLEKRALNAERQIDDLQNKVTEQRHTIYALATELEDEKGKNLKLRAQNNRDYENSSLPSSKSTKNKKIVNSREKTGKKPGGQPGHQGHCRKKQVPTSKPIMLSAPQEVLDDPDCEKKGHKGVKGTVVEEYQGTLIHDHESTFFNYGSDHQECLAHVLRYLKDSINNESERTWNKQMHSLIRKMIHYRNNLIPETDISMKKIAVSNVDIKKYSNKQRRNTSTSQQISIIEKDITCICEWKSICPIIYCF